MSSPSTTCSARYGCKPTAFSGASSTRLFRPQLFPRFALAGIPYDGTWTVRFNGDYSGYSDLYNSSCVDPGVFRRGGGFAAVKVVGGAGVLCVPPMSMLVLTRA